MPEREREKGYPLEIDGVSYQIDPSSNDIISLLVYTARKDSEGRVAELVRRIYRGRHGRRLGKENRRALFEELNKEQRIADALAGKIPADIRFIFSEVDGEKKIVGIEIKGGEHSFKGKRITRG
jgi:hypothetical protein